MFDFSFHPCTCTWIVKRMNALSDTKEIISLRCCMLMTNTSGSRVADWKANVCIKVMDCTHHNATTKPWVCTTFLIFLLSLPCLLLKSLNTRSFSILSCLWQSFLYFSLIITCAYCYSCIKIFPHLLLTKASWPSSSTHQTSTLCPGCCYQITQIKAFTVELGLLPWWPWSLQHFFQ